MRGIARVGSGELKRDEFDARGELSKVGALMHSCSCLWFLSLVLVSSACGSRTGIDDGFSVGLGGLMSDAGLRDATRRDSALADATLKDAPASGEPDRSVPPPTVDGGTVPGILDKCPSAVAAGSPLPMLRSCSTRDGRSRVAGPKAPHLTWKSHLPHDPTFAPLGLGWSILAGGASGAVYVASEISSQPLSITSINEATGAVTWTASLPSESVASYFPFVAASGAVEDIAFTAAGPSIAAFAAQDGTLTYTPLPASLAVTSIPAIGADGSLYVAYTDNTNPLGPTAAVSRIHADDTLAWTADGLSAGSVSFDGFSTIALGVGDMVLVGAASSKGNASAVVALSPDTGAVLWTTNIPGELSAGPAVGADGAIVVFAGEGDGEQVNATSALYVLGPNGEILYANNPLAFGGVTSIYAIGLDGTILVPGAALSRDGSLLWSSVGTGVIIDSNGTVVMNEDTIVGRALATGEKLWTLDKPKGLSFSAFSLTGQGGLVLFTGEGAIFGASD